MMCINEHIKVQLDLPVMDTIKAELADGSLQTMEVVGPLIINFKNRTTSCNAAVLPGESEILLGGNSYGRYGCSASTKTSNYRCKS